MREDVGGDIVSESMKGDELHSRKPIFGDSLSLYWCCVFSINLHKIISIQNWHIRQVTLKVLSPN
jgi:hypothetical protein